MSLSRWSELPNGLQATYNRLASFDPKRGDAMSLESFWRSAVAIGISVAAIWTVADVIAAGGASTSRPLQPIRKDLVIRFRRQRLAREAIMAAKEISVKKYVVRLSGEERERLETLLRKGKSPARRVLKARILLKADVSEAGKGWSDNRIIEALETSPSMVYRVRKQLVEEGFEA